MMLKRYILLFLVISCCLSCASDEKKRPSASDLEYYKIEKLKGAFPLPRSFVGVSREELSSYSSRFNVEAVQEFLKASENLPQAHFSQVFAPNGFVSVLPAVQRIPIRKEFSTMFVNLIETQAYGVKTGILSYDIVQNKFLSVGQSKAFKLKIRASIEDADVYTTHYLITTPHESLIVIEHSKDEADLQDAIATYMIKNS